MLLHAQEFVEIKNSCSLESFPLLHNKSRESLY
jgi:hypothetical protein